MKWTKNLARIGGAAIAISLAGGMVACAQTPAKPDGTATTDFPKRTIQLVVPFGAGGATDLLARAYAQELEKELDATVVVVNKPGGSTAVAASEVAGAKADGYTLLVGTTTTFSTTPLLQEVSYTADDFVGLAGLGDTPYAIVTGPDSGLERSEDLLELEGSVKYSIDAVGNNTHLALADLLQALGIEGDYVPFDSSQESLTAVMGGHVLMSPTDLNVAGPQIADGSVNIVAVSSPERLEAYPEVWTTSELTDGKAKPFQGSYAIVAPAGLDPEIQSILEKAAQNAAKSAGFSEYREKNSILPPEYPDGQEWLTEMIPNDQGNAEQAMRSLGLLK